jgi:hypothetical protein
VVIEERTDEGKGVPNSVIVASGYSGDGDDSL